MSNRRGPRSRNNKRGIKEINIKPIAIALLVIIAVLISILKIKDYRNSIIASKEIEKQEKEMYLLFEGVDNAKKELNLETKDKEDTVAKIVTVGDILCEDSIIKDGYDSKSGKYNFSHMFSNIKEYTKEADITLGLLETNFVSGEKYSGNIKYNSPKEFGKELKNIGIDILHTANNHSLDYGFKGVKSTLNFLNELGIDTLGTYKTKKEASEILVKDVNGIKIAFLSYTYGTNISVPEKYNYSVNLTDKTKMKSDLKEAKKQEVDFIFVHMHWGDVDNSKPNKEQKELADFLFKNGANFVLGSHPASLQPMEVRKNGEGENIFIAYSTGNFISSSSYQNSNIEMILNIEVTKKGDTEKTYLSRVTYEPVYLLDRGESAKQRYTLLNIKEEVANYESANKKIINEKIYKELKQALKDIEKLIGKN